MSEITKRAILDEIKKLRAKGMSNLAIARKLGISESSVRRISQDSQRL